MSQTAITPQRHWLMTGVLWAVLLACLGGAALMIHLKAKLWNIVLTEPQKIGSIELSLPRDWAVAYAQHGEVEEVQATETRPPGRILSISTDTTSVEELVEQIRHADALEEETFDIPGGSGSIVYPGRAMPFAILNFQSGRSAVIEFARSGRPTTQDIALLYHIAKSIRLGDAPEPAPRRRLRFGHEI